MIFSKTHSLTIVLVVSLASNFFLAGLYVGHRTPPPFLAHYGGPRPPGPRGAARALEEALSPQDAKVFHSIMEEELPGSDDKDMESSFNTLETMLKAPDFDPKAFRTAMQHIHDQHTALDMAFVKAVSDGAAKISPEGRVKLAEEIAKFPHGGEHSDQSPPSPPSPPQ